MTNAELVAALRKLSVETGSLACLGCGHEHSCGTRGCALMRQAADALENTTRHVEALQAEFDGVWAALGLAGESEGQ